MRQKIYKLVIKSGFSSLLLLPYRIKLVVGYHRKLIPQVFNWLARSKEITNFTYELTEINESYLLAMICTVTGTGMKEVGRYLKEIKNDKKIKNHVVKVTKNSNFKDVSDETPAFGRRIGWYIFMRVLKPKIVVETGVGKGLGSCLITSALIRNKSEGFPGYYYGTDINPEAGFLFCEPYSNYGKILYGDSVESLRRLDERIDLFINDSVHTYEYEKREYKTIEGKLKKKSIIIADNAHNNLALLEFAEKTKRRFLFFKEQPKNHWYPGGGMGVAFR